MNIYMDAVLAQLDEAGVKYVPKTQYHVMIPAPNGKRHNVWVSKTGKIRVRIDGHLNAKPLNDDEWRNLLIRFIQIRERKEWERRRGNGELGTVLE